MTNNAAPIPRRGVVTNAALLASSIYQVDICACDATDHIRIAVVILADGWIGVLRHRDQINGRIAAAAGIAHVDCEGELLAGEMASTAIVVDARIVAGPKQTARREAAYEPADCCEELRLKIIQIRAYHPHTLSRHGA